LDGGFSSLPSSSSPSSAQTSLLDSYLLPITHQTLVIYPIAILGTPFRSITPLLALTTETCQAFDYLQEPSAITRETIVLLPTYHQITLPSPPAQSWLLRLLSLLTTTNIAIIVANATRH